MKNFLSLFSLSLGAFFSIFFPFSVKGNTSAGIQFRVVLHPLSQHCFYDTFLEHMLIIVTAKPLTNDVVQLIIAHKNIVVFEDTQDKIIQTAFTAGSSGEYSICLSNKARNFTSVHFHLKKGSEAKDYSEIAKKEHLDPGVDILKNIQDKLQVYHRNLFFLRSQEASMARLHNATAYRVVIFCCINLIVMLGATIIHVLHIRNFFRRKKII